MSGSDDPRPPRRPWHGPERRRVARFEGDLLGFQYELGIEAAELAPPAAQPPPPAGDAPAEDARGDDPPAP